MAVNNTKARNTYTSTGGLRYDFQFGVTDISEIEVISTDLAILQDTKLENIHDYTVVKYPENTGGYITLTPFGLAKAVTGRIVTIKRNPNITQDCTFVENDPFYIATIEKMMDRLTYTAQTFKDDLSRTIKFPEGTVDVPTYKSIIDKIDTVDLAKAQADEVLNECKLYASDAAESVSASAEETVKAAAHANTALGYSNAAEGSLAAVDTKVELASKWAINPEGEEVDNGKFSAYHYAMQARDAGEIASLDEALGGVNNAKVMTPLITKSAVTKFATLDYARTEAKTWNTIQFADKSGFLNLNTSFGDIGGNVLEVKISPNSNMSGSTTVLYCDNSTVYIRYQTMIPIQKGLYYKITGGQTPRIATLIPFAGE